MDRFEAMRIFIRVAELQSFTQAAKVLNLPKATVSTSVQNLESLVNVRLLNRTTRQVQLTSEGTSFLERCKYLLGDLEEAESMFRSDAVQIRGKIRVDMVVPLARVIFIPLLPSFLEMHPEIEIELSCTDRKIDFIRDGIDFMIRGGSSGEPGLVERDLGAAAIVNCASPVYIAKYGKPKSIEDLKSHRLVQFTYVLGGKPEGFEYFDGEKYREAKMGGCITVNNPDAYTSASLAGLGITQEPFGVVANYLKSGALIEVLPKFKAEPMRIKMVYPQPRLLPKRVRVLMDWYASAIKDLLK